jgi:hypothetical protein
MITMIHGPKFMQILPSHEGRPGGESDRGRRRGQRMGSSGRHPSGQVRKLTRLGEGTDDIEGGAVQGQHEHRAKPGRPLPSGRIGPGSAARTPRVSGSARHRRGGFL